MNREHHYTIDLDWLGNRGTGTSGFRDYGRELRVIAEGKHQIDGSADRTFHGDRDRWNPEELLLAALSQCHMLSFLFIAASKALVVMGYSDSPTGTLRLAEDDSGRFTSVTLRPRVELADESQRELSDGLHALAYSKCFIAQSVNFPVLHRPIAPE